MRCRGQRAGVGLDGRPQGFDGVMEAGLRRPGGNLESVGHLVHREAVVEAQDQDAALRVGQPAEAALELVPIGQLGRAIELARFGRDDRDLRAPLAPTSADVVAGVDEQPVEPGVEPLRVAQRGQIAPGSDQRFLGGILRELGVAQDVASGRVQPIDGTAGKHAEGLAVSALCPVDELRLHAPSLSEATDLVTYTVRRPDGHDGSNLGRLSSRIAAEACDTPGMAGLAELADRLDRAAEDMVELGPQLAAGEPWAMAEQVGPGPESSWGPREVLAHVAEMLPYWLGEIELILDAAGQGEPYAFGRLEDDPIRIAIIDRDRAFPARELLGRVEAEAKRVARRFRMLGDADGAALGRHASRGDLTVQDIAERFIVGHMEGHVTQLREAVGGGG